MKIKYNKKINFFVRNKDSMYYSNLNKYLSVSRNLILHLKILPKIDTMQHSTRSPFVYLLQKLSFIKKFVKVDFSIQLNFMRVSWRSR